MKKIFVGVVCFVIAGCAAQHCIKIGGEFSGVAGEIEYCYSPEKTKAEGTPVFTPKNSANAATLFAFTEAEVKDLNAMLEQQEAVVKAKEEEKRALARAKEVKAKGVAKAEESPCKGLKCKIKDFRKVASSAVVPEPATDPSECQKLKKKLSEFKKTLLVASSK